MKIATPFGGMTVKTNDAAVMDGLGLPVYPGAELVKKKDKTMGRGYQYELRELSRCG